MELVLSVVLHVRIKFKSLADSQIPLNIFIPLSKLANTLNALSTSLVNHPPKENRQKINPSHFLRVVFQNRGETTDNEYLKVTRKYVVVEFNKDDTCFAD